MVESLNKNNKFY